MGSDPLLLLAVNEETAVKAILFVLVLTITIFGLSKVREALLGRKDLIALALGACGAAGVFVGALGVAEILYVWYNGFPGLSTLDLLVHGLLLVLAAALLDRWWPAPPPPNPPAPPVTSSST
ncbi:MAG: hypothetical protein HYY93_15215 [Planctomycetes bacterium]|nr:hypothetical protein [Planctomycetota bacterium]